jgi:hypothetical protein
MQTKDDTMVEKILKQLRNKAKALEKLQTRQDRLLEQKNALQSKLKAVENEISETEKTAQQIFDGDVKTTVASKPAQEKLGNLLVRLLKDRTSFRISDAVKAALDAGYQTRSKNFKHVVALWIGDDKRFRRIHRGIYRIETSEIPQSQHWFKQGDHKDGKTMASFLYRFMPKGQFELSDAADLMKKAGYKRSKETLIKSLSARLGEDNRFRRIKRGTWIRVFPANRK